MDDRLAVDADAFSQDSQAWPARTGDRPGAKRIDGSRVVTVRHAAASPAARDALQALGLAWPERVGDLTGGPGSRSWATRRHPEECLVVGTDAEIQDALLAALAPARAADVVAIDLTHGVVVVALEGPHLDDWLARLVDVDALPRVPGRAAHARMIDIAVGLLRLADDRLWLLADRALAPYVANWLTFTHAAAFASSG